MIETLNRADVTSDLRYALEVLDEYEHLGLDAEHAIKIRNNPCPPHWRNGRERVMLPRPTDPLAT